MANLLNFALSAAIIVGPMLLTRKPKPVEYEQRPFLNGTLFTPKS